MAETAADVLVETLQAWGVEVVFGLPGDGINGIMEALRTRRDATRFVQVRHEESAAFMACAYAKYTGRLGVCLATSGPGGLHLINGLYDAKLDAPSPAWPTACPTPSPPRSRIPTGTLKVSFHGLKPGPHRIKVALAANDHSPLGPEQTLDVNIPATAATAR
jgi:glyoxylate carboligase